MNHTYRLVWNDTAKRHVPVAETARARKKGPGGNHVARNCVIVVAAALAGALASNTRATPTGGTVVAGQAAIDQTGATTTIRQQSQTASLNWQGFSIGSQETVQFVQPSATAIALNRVVGGDPSEIYGHLLANGQIFLVNPKGVLFGPSAQVNVGSLVASSLNISDEDFLAGNYRFRNSGSKSDSAAAPASVINQGTLTASPGGSVALLGGQVSNSGTITAQRGTVALAAGSAMTLDFQGNRLLNVQVDGAAADALAENHQLIQADGGTVIMTAAARNALLKTVVNNTGVIEARTIDDRSGEIKLLGSQDGGTVAVSGRLDASAPTGGDGGHIETSGEHVHVADETRITTAAAHGTTGSWLVDPTDYTIAPTGGDISGSALSSILETTSYTVLSTKGNASGNGNILVNDAVAWSAGTTLTLSAQNDLVISQSITAKGDGAGVAFNLPGRDYYSLSSNAQITLSGATPKFSINGTNYTVINSLGVDGDTSKTTLQGIAGNLAGYYVLGTNIDAKDTATSAWSRGGFVPIGSSGHPFTGELHGLGHVISNLTVSPQVNSSPAGLFGVTVLGSEIRNVGISAATVVSTLQDYNQVGALVGWNGGIVEDAWVDSNTRVQGYTYVGGLVGQNDGWISRSYSSATVTALNDAAGGLVGRNIQTIEIAYANGPVSQTGTGKDGAGGLIGLNEFIVNTCYAAAPGLTGPLTGGLIATSTRPSLNFVSNNYWTGPGSSDGSGPGATYLNAAASQLQSSYVGGFWAFSNFWRFYNGHTTPLLVDFLTPLKITADPISLTYDGNTHSPGLLNPTYSIASAATSTNLFGVNSAYNARNAGTYQPDIWSNQQGYDITMSGGALTIKPAVLAIQIPDVVKTYDGSTNAKTHISQGGGIVPGSLGTGDTITDFTLAFTDKNAGTRNKEVDLTSITIADGNGGRNYTISATPNTTSTINKASITLTPTTHAKYYDGNTTSDGAVAWSYLSPTDQLVANEVYTSKNALGTNGSTLQVVPGYTITDSTGANMLGNYTITLETNSGTIDPASLTLSAVTDSKIYDGTTSSGQKVDVKGFVSGDIVSATQAFASKDVKGNNGSTLQVVPGFTVTDASGADMLGNYTVNTSGTALGTITPAALTVTTQNVIKIYDGTLSAAGTLSLSSGKLVGSDSFSGGTFAFTDKNAGSNKTVKTSGVTVNDGNNGNNYAITYIDNTTSTITKANLTLAATSSSKMYDGTTASSGVVSATGLATGDKLTAAEAYTSKDVNGSGGSTLHVSAYYSVNDSAGANMLGNYTVDNSATAAGTITPKALTVSGITARNKVYDGTASAILNTGSATLTGRIAGDTTLGVSGTGTFADANAGTNKAVTLSNLTLTGNDSGNYVLMSAGSESSTTASITPASLTITVNNTTRAAGAPNPAFTFNYQGFAAGDSASSLTTPPTATTIADALSVGGLYPITASGAVDPNYVFIYVPGTLTVVGTPITTVAASPAFQGAVASVANVQGTGSASTPSQSARNSNLADGDSSAGAPDGDPDRRTSGTLSIWSLDIVDRGINLPVGVH